MSYQITHTVQIVIDAVMEQEADNFWLFLQEEIDDLTLRAFANRVKVTISKEKDTD